MGLTEVRTYTKNRSKQANSNTGIQINVQIREENNKCIGTDDNSIIWCNSNDISGIILATVVWILILYSIGVCLLIALDKGESEYNRLNGYIIISVCVMSLWCHGATMLGDPGAVPHNAKPLAKDIDENSLVICGVCECFKPPGSHHDSVSGRCVSRMDHFCPWTNK